MVSQEPEVAPASKKQNEEKQNLISKDQYHLITDIKEIDNWIKDANTWLQVADKWLQVADK